MMGLTAIATISAVTPGGGDFAGAAMLMIVGLLVVFTTLVVLAVLIGGLVRLGREAPRDDGGDAGAAPAAGETGQAGRVDRRHLVVIAAAVAAAAGPRARVHRVVMLGRESGRQWVTEGRVVVMGSHRLHR
jgi:Na+-transporting methylmalonyl-CoA/oxaloacetate decarboxylase gamma subunit